MSNKLPITNLDFADIKSSLQTYLEGQSQFQDYNFEGSNLQVLLDILAYNTWQNNFYTNMAVSEMFIDSAQIKNSIVSHAKELNYLPASRSSAEAIIDVTLTVSDGSLFVTIPARTAFTARCGSATYTFYNHDSVAVYPVGGVYTATDLTVYEGKYVTEYFEVTGDSDQRFILSNENIDTNSLKVYVLDNAQDTDKDEYVVKANLFGIASDDKVFYLQAYDDDQYEIVFGKDVFGAAPIDGNIVEVQYRVTSGDDANGITSISAPSTIAGYAASATLVTASNSGSERESIESIRYFAPRSIQIQERAVTESDYEILLRNKFPEIQAISVYGGEEADPPQFGRVLIAVDETGRDGLSSVNRTRYQQYVADRSPMAITPIVVAPQFMYLDVDTTIRYNTATTTKSSSDIRSLVQTAILDFSNDYLADFDVTFRYSKFIAAIDDADENIISNETTVRAIIEVSPAFGDTNSYTLPFKNTLVTADSTNDYTPAITSTTFTYDGSTCYIEDDANGTLRIYTTSATGSQIGLAEIGTVDYTTGKCVIQSLTVDSYSGSAIKFYAQINSRDIDGPRERILSIRAADVRISVTGTRA